MSCPSENKNPDEFPCSSTDEYKKLTKIFHPDRNPGCIEDSTKKFQYMKNMCDKNIDEKDDIFQPISSSSSNKSKKTNKKTTRKNKTHKMTRSRSITPASYDEALKPCAEGEYRYVDKAGKRRCKKFDTDYEKLSPRSKYRAAYEGTHFNKVSAIYDKAKNNKKTNKKVSSSSDSYANLKDKSKSTSSSHSKSKSSSHSNSKSDSNNVKSEEDYNDM